MAGGRKYNIWIAYSDLFTNLSTFLFVSALGMFAAIGSGLLAPPGWGGSTGCEVPAAIEASLTANGSILEPLGPAADPCTRYYRIGTFRFRYSADGIGEFKNDQLQPLDPARGQAGICEPLWLTISRSDFIEAKGQLTFQGISSPDNGWKYQPECKRLSKLEPRINHRNFPQGKTAAFVIGECDRLPDKAYPALCPQILACKSKPEDDWNTLCQEVDAARKWAAHVPAACLRDVGHQHARQLYNMCELAPVNESFPDHKFLGDDIDKRARPIHGRPYFWESGVDYAVPRGGTISLAPPDSARPATAMPLGGAVVVEVRFGG